MIINKGNPNSNDLSNTQQNSEKQKDTIVQKNPKNKEQKSKENKNLVPIDVEIPISSLNL